MAYLRTAFTYSWGLSVRLGLLRPICGHLLRIRRAHLFDLNFCGISTDSFEVFADFLYEVKSPYKMARLLLSRATAPRFPIPPTAPTAPKQKLFLIVVSFLSVNFPFNHADYRIPLAVSRSWPGTFSIRCRIPAMAADAPRRPFFIGYKKSLKKTPKLIKIELM